MAIAKSARADVRIGWLVDMARVVLISALVVAAGVTGTLLETRHASAQQAGPAASQPMASSPADAPASSRPQPSRSFLPPKSDAGPVAITARPAVATPAPSGIFDRFYRWTLEKQREINRALAGSVRALKEGGNLSAALFLASLSFLYGVLHAAGPGHGKAVVTSYVLADRQTVRRGVLLSFMAAFAQALMALAVVGVLVLLLNATQSDIKATEAWLEQASWAIIAGLGAWLLWRQVKPMLATSPVPAAASHYHHHHDHGHGHHQHHHDHGHHHHHHDHGHHQHGYHHHDGAACDQCGHAHMPAASELQSEWSWRRASAMAFAIGLRPCTGAILVLVFAVSQGLMWAGVVATFAMAIGTAITVSALAALAASSRDFAARFAGGGTSSAWARGLQSAIGIGAALIVLLLGVSFFIYSLDARHVF